MAAIRPTGSRGATVAAAGVADTGVARAGFDPGRCRDRPGRLGFPTLSPEGDPGDRGDESVHHPATKRTDRGLMSTELLVMLLEEVQPGGRRESWWHAHFSFFLWYLVFLTLRLPIGPIVGPGWTKQDKKKSNDLPDLPSGQDCHPLVKLHQAEPRLRSGGWRFDCVSPYLRCARPSHWPAPSQRWRRSPGPDRSWAAVVRGTDIEGSNARYHIPISSS